nr:NADH dehydrogenase subunit 1 [Musculium lacustre]
MVVLLFTMVMILFGVAFVIVTERKGLGMVQLRQGPNKVSVKGILQPVADGVKLFKKEFLFLYFSSKVLYCVGPCISFLCAYSMWVLFPASLVSHQFELGILYFLCVSSFSVYGVFLVGWVCDSRYAFLGAMRAVAQTISYEVVMSIIVFCPLLFLGSFNLSEINNSGFLGLFLMFEVLLAWIFVMLAETHRTPFDFVEGESELVAGYNVEFGGVGFAILALSEYSNIFFMSFLSGVIFVGFSSLFSFFLINELLTVIFMVIFTYFVICIRGVLPRFRYDLLMNTCWILLLPLFLSVYSLFLCIL